MPAIDLNNTDRVFRGATEIIKMYHGSTAVWEKPAASAFPTTDPGLLNWWDASTGMSGSGAGFSLADSVGGKTLVPTANDSDVIQTTYNGLPAVQTQNLDGIIHNDTMTFPAEWMLIYTMDVQASSNNWAGSVGLSARGGAGQEFYLRPRPPNRHQMLHRSIQAAGGGFVQGPQGPSSGAYYNTGSMHIFALVFNSTNDTFGLVVDQTLLGVITYANDWANVNNGRLVLAGQNQAARPMDTRIGEVILTTSVDQTTRANYEAYLASKWGITL